MKVKVMILDRTCVVDRTQMLDVCLSECCFHIAGAEKVKHKYAPILIKQLIHV